MSYDLERVEGVRQAEMDAFSAMANEDRARANAVKELIRESRNPERLMTWMVALARTVSVTDQERRKA